MATKAQVLEAKLGGGPFRPRDLVRLGISPSNLTRWVEQGLVERVTRGVYRIAEADSTELGTVAEVVRRAPRSVVCLLTALQFHGLGVEAPHAVWLMIERHARRPKIDFVATEVVRASGPALTHGVQVHLVEGVQVAITSPAKTVADCFRFRRHVGLEVALDALRDYLDQRNRRRGADYSVQALTDAMRACRVKPLMTPYVEALV